MPKTKTYRIKDLHKVDRPREKLAHYGPEKLSNSELLAILIGSGYKGKNVIKVAQTILRKYSTKGLRKVNFKQLSKEKGLGPAKVTQILAAIEIGKRIYNKEDTIKFSKPEDVYEHLRNLRTKKKEHFVALYLNSQNELIHEETISIGSLNANIVHPREVFEPAIKHLAAGIIVAHNHPSNRIKPSKEDKQITKELVKSGEILGIEIYDHLIITKRGFISFKDNHLL